MPQTTMVASDEEDVEVIDIAAQRHLLPTSLRQRPIATCRVQISEARALLERSRRLLDKMTAEDREEAIGFHEQIEEALKTAQWQHVACCHDGAGRSVVLCRRRLASQRL